MLYFNIHVCLITEEKDCALIKLHLFNPVTIRHLCHVSKFTSFSLQIQLVTLPACMYRCTKCYCAQYCNETVHLTMMGVINASRKIIVI